MFLNCMPRNWVQAPMRKPLFEAAYLKHDNLADTRQLANSFLEHTVW
jgi:hypothetical protein